MGRPLTTNAEIIAAVERWQADPTLVSLTCKTDNSHRKLAPLEADGKVVLACPDCDYRQSSVPWTVTINHKIASIPKL